MRTAIIIVGGLVSLGVFVLVSWWLGGGPQSTTTAAKVSGYRVAFITAAIMLGAGAVILAATIRRRDVENLDVAQLAPSAAAA